MIWSPKKRFWVVCLAAYLALMVAAVCLLIQIRAEQIARLSTPRALDAWQDWRSAAAQQAGPTGPVQRRTPNSTEPPALVLLRDHFALVVAAAIVFGTALLAVILFAIHGVLARTHLAHLNRETEPARDDR